MSNNENSQAKVVFQKSSLRVLLPIATPTGKVRVKDRNVFYEYGKPVSTRSVEIPSSAYIEWQIGYDLKSDPENLVKTTLTDKEFINYKGNKKLPYELSEVLFYSYRLDLISIKEIAEVKIYIKNFSKNDLLENSLEIWRSHPVKKTIAGIDFEAMKVQYPLLVRRFDGYEVIAEILVTEKQRAVGIQPMLYVCLPVKSVHSMNASQDVFGRIAEKKEMVSWEINRTEARFMLEVARLFGLLSRAHREDMLAILEKLFPSI